MSFNSQSGQSPADYLRQLYNKNMNATQIFLDFRAITDILPLIHLLAGFKKLKKLSLHGNRLTQLPTDLSVFRYLQILDISNNLLQNNVQLTTLSLKTLPNLKSLIYPIPKQKQQKLIQQLKTLNFFNNIKIQRVQAKKEYIFNLLNNRTIDQYQNNLCSMYQQIMQFQKKYLNQKPQSNSLQRFKQDLRVVSKDILSKLQKYKQHASSSLQYIMLYIAKYQMFQFIRTKSMNICQDIYGDLGDFIYKISQQHDQLFRALSDKALHLTTLQSELKEKQEEQKIKAQQNGDYHILNKNIIMQKEIRRLKKQKEQMAMEISQLENQNKKLIDAVMKYSKGDKYVLASVHGNINGFNVNMNGSFMAKENGKYTTNNNTNNYNNNSNISNQSLLIPAQLSNRSQIPTLPQNLLKSSQKPSSRHQHQASNHKQLQPPSSSNYNTSSNRNLTLKQLKDIIQQIYQSKLKFDEKNYDGKIARQTMHQYLFTYLNQKYGLKTLTIQAAASIVSGIQSYSSEDNDVCVFGKILRNQIDQQFRFVQTQLKTTITDLLKMHIKTKMQYKSAIGINQYLQEKLNGEIIWEEVEDIVKYLYNKEDSQAIIKKLDVLFRVSQKQYQNNINNNKSIQRRLTREQQANLIQQKHVRKLKFNLFLKCVLDFQLKNHQKLLKPLVKSFKLRDSNTDGIIDQQQFLHIIQDLCPQQQNIIPYLLNIVDPYEIKLITFTQMVRLVANYPQNNPILSRFLNKNEQGRDDYYDNQNENEQNEEYSRGNQTTMMNNFSHQNNQSQQFRTYG